MKKYISVICLGSSLFLSGCMPVYQVKDLNKSVLVNVKAIKNPEICVNGKPYALLKDGAGMTRVPYGHRITMMDNFSQTQSIANFNITNYCNVAISFIPKKGHRYMLSFRVRNRQCVLNVLRYNQKSKVGLQIEPSARASSCPPPTSFPSANNPFGFAPIPALPWQTNPQG